MKFFANLLILIGFCLGTLGAAGFHSPSKSANAPEDPTAVVEPESMLEKTLITEEYAKVGFGIGIALLVMGGVLMKRAKAALAAGGDSAGAVMGEIDGDIQNLQDAVAWLESNKESLHREELHRKIGELLDGPYDELTVRSDAITALLGFDTYAKVWGGVATCERLLNRAWSMLADGHPTEAKLELPLALDAIRAARREIGLASGSQSPGDPPPTFE